MKSQLVTGQKTTSDAPLRAAQINSVRRVCFVRSMLLFNAEAHRTQRRSSLKSEVAKVEIRRKTEIRNPKRA